MKQKSLSTLALVVLAMGAFGTGVAEAQNIAPGLYYATPSWDQTFTCTSSADCPRFIVLKNMNDAAVLDLATGLVWERQPSVANDTDTRGAAMGTCWNATTGGSMGWRLPRAEELMSLADPTNFAHSSLSAGNPFQDVFYFPKPVGAVGVYWSADLAPGVPGYAISVIFYTGLATNPPVVTYIVPSGPSGVWCVRSANGSTNPQ